MTARLIPGVAIAALTLAGCGGTPSEPANPGQSSTPPPTASAATSVPRSAVVYLTAWAATDISTMTAASSPATPARTFARYWADAFRAGRVDSGQGEVTVHQRSVDVTLDGEEYRFTGFRTGSDGRLATWTSQPGGPLGPRVVAGPPVSVEIGGMRVTALRQYRNGEGDLRVSLRIRAHHPVDLAASDYQPGDRTATLGSGGTTGVITPDKGVTWAVASVESGTVGGTLRLRTFTGSGKVTDRAALPLP